MITYIPCQNCKDEYPKEIIWFVCDRCGFHICEQCNGEDNDKCHICTYGYLERKY